MLKINDLNESQIFTDDQYKFEVISNLKKGEIYIQRSALPLNTVDKLKNYLSGLVINFYIVLTFIYTSCMNT